MISIHAPVKGATSKKARIQMVMGYFNPRTREGCDSVSGYSPSWPQDFNPRTREGCDSVVDPYEAHVKLISIHAPVKGATRMTGDTPRPLVCISIHAPVKGATPYVFESEGVEHIFQSTHP